MQQTAHELIQLAGEITRGAKVISLSGLTSISAKAFVLSRLRAETGKSFVIVTDSNKESDDWETDLRFWLSNISSQLSVSVLPSFESDVYSGVSPHAETLERRALTLWRLARPQAGFLVLPAKALITRTHAPTAMRDLGAVLKLDEDFPPEELVQKLTAAGYVREDPISGVGQFSLRGGIVDVWSPDAESPVRVEFFGDTVDSIRAFDAETQLSTGQLKEVAIAPMREFAATATDLRDWTFLPVKDFQTIILRAI